MTQTKSNYTRVLDYGITEAFVNLDWETQETSEKQAQRQIHSHAFNFQDLAGALWDCGRCDGYSLLNEEIVCFMDGRPGFHSTALPSEVWAALSGIDRQSVCLQMIFELEKTNAK